LSGSNINDTTTTVSPYYTVKISATGGAGGSSFISARTPNRVDFVADSSWRPLLTDISHDTNINFLANQIGFSSLNLFSGAQVWEGTTPIVIVLDLEFFAFRNAAQEVIKPIKDLAKLVLPRRGVFLRPPGPRLSILAGALGGGLGGTQINVFIGTFMFLRSVIMKSVTPNFVLQMSPEGNPMKASVKVVIETFYVATVEMIDEILPTA